MTTTSGLAAPARRNRRASVEDLWPIQAVITNV